MHDSYLPTFLMRSLPMISKRTVGTSITYIYNISSGKYRVSPPPGRRRYLIGLLGAAVLLLVGWVGDVWDAGYGLWQTTI